MKKYIPLYLKFFKTRCDLVSGSQFFKNFLLWIFILTFIPIMSFSQNTNFFVSGQVTNNETLMPIENQLVCILSDTLDDIPDTYYNELFTNTEGVFHISIPFPITDRTFFIYTYDCDNLLYDTSIFIPANGISNNEDIVVDFQIFEENTSSCNSDFFYYQDTLSHQDNCFYFFDNSGEDVESWIWDFGDGHYSTQKDPVHQYEKFGLYTVSMISHSYDIFSNLCVDTIQKQLNVGGLDYYNFGGHAFAGEFPIDIGCAYLYQVNTDNIIPIDTAIMDTLGFYYFYQKPEGLYLVKTNLNEESELYPDYFPTYFGNELLWEDAETIELDHNYWEYNIDLIASTTFESGNGKINGNVEFFFEKDNNSIPASQIELLLKDENEDYLMCSHSDNEGEFFFIGLPIGSYEIIPEYTGIETNSLIVNLTSSQPIINNADITINIADTVSTFSIDENISTYIEKVGQVYPNPASNTAKVQISVLKSTNIKILLFNQFGQLAYSENKSLTSGDHTIKVNISNLAKGFYNLHILTGDNIGFTQKMIKL